MTNPLDSTNPENQTSPDEPVTLPWPPDDTGDTAYVDAVSLAADFVAENAEPRPWDRQPGETDTHYIWFLVYLNSGFGSARSLQAGYRAWLKKYRGKDIQPHEQVSDARWRLVASKNNWKERAFEYDVHMLAREGAQTVLSWISLLRLASQRALVEVMNNPEMRPKTFGQLMTFLQVFGEFIPQETVSELQNSARDNQTPGIGS